MARGLNGFLSPEHQAVAFSDRFSPSTLDATWTTQLAQEKGWAIVALDPAISNNPHKLEAWKLAGVTTFILHPAWLGMTGWVQAQQIVKWMPRIIEKAVHAAGGSVFIIHPSGQIEDCAQARG